jgi:20S proteasome alpha/beta subunit
VPLETLILHGLKALSTGVGNDEEITERNIEVSHVGEDGFKMLRTEDIRAYLDRLQNVDLASFSSSLRLQWTSSTLPN